MSKAFISETSTSGEWTSIYRHTGSLKKIVEHLTPEQFQLLIPLAVSALDSMNSSASTSEYKDTLAKEIARHTDVFVSERKKYEEKISGITSCAETDKETLALKHSREMAIFKSRIEELQRSLDLEKSSSADMKSRVEKAYKEDLAREVSRSADVFAAEKRQLEEKIHTLSKVALTEKETEQMKHSREMSILRSQVEDLQARLNLSQTTYADIKAKSEESFKASISEIVKQKDIQHEKELMRLEQSTKDRVEESAKQHIAAMENIKQLYAEKEALLQKDIKSLVSSDIGAQGEKEFDELALEYTNWGPLVNTSKTPHATDRSCTVRKCPVFIEVKNYTGDVPSKEVTKFQRDMEEHADVPFGVFISLKTGIAGKKSQNFICEWTAKSQMLVYINSFYSHSVKDIFKFLDMCVDIARRVFTLAQQKPEDSDETLRLQGQIENIKVIIQAESKRIGEMLKSLKVDKTQLIDMINKQYIYNENEIRQSKASLVRILDVILGNDETEDDVVGSLEEKTDKPVKKPRAKKLNKADSVAKV